VTHNIQLNKYPVRIFLCNRVLCNPCTVLQNQFRVIKFELKADKERERKRERERERGGGRYYLLTAAENSPLKRKNSAHT